MRALIVCAFSLLMLAGGAHAQSVQQTATCKDGTTWSGTGRITACLGHQGVKAFGAPVVAATPTTISPAPSGPPPPTAPTPTAPAVGGGAGQVWVNTSTKVYHCQGDHYYGKTKRGAYMTEAAAKAAGDHADHGKACS